MLVEGFEREKAEKFAFAKYLSVFLEPMSGLKKEDTIKALADYGEELYQLKYNYNYESIRTRLDRVRTEHKLDDMRLLDKVSAMTVED